MIWLEVSLTLLRELLRTLITPVRLLLYLPARKKWRRVAQEVLDGVADAAPEDPRQALAGFFARRRPHRGAAPHLFLSAGEASGEGHAVRLLQALHATHPQLRCTAFGGPPLQAAGADVRAMLSEHAVMGVGGVLKQLPLILRAFAT
ncbi:MAG: hypothetical protein KDC48_12035, partial [Planctomycetes bacterium]|nr:hypothetical protein [Planctomycetota bacterium]